MESRNVGLNRNAEVNEQDKQECGDNRCPFHGTLSIRGRQFDGVVVSAKMRKTAVVESKHRKFIKKYSRYEGKTRRLNAHNPKCLNVSEGELVRIAECRPLSKTKNFVIIGKHGIKKGFKERMGALRASKRREEKKEERDIKEGKEIEDGKN